MKKKFIAIALGATLSGLSCFTFAGCSHKHNYESVYQPATCTDRGYTLHSCTGCGYQYADGFVEPYEHAYEHCLNFAVPAEEKQAARAAEYVSFNGLPTSRLIGQPVCEVSMHQQALAQYMSDLLKKEFDSASQSNSMEMIVFQKSECPFCGDGEIKAHTISVPILATVPTPSFDIDGATVNFTMNITPSESDSPAFRGDGHEHGFDFWTDLSGGTSKVNSATVASVPTDYVVSTNGELSVDVCAGGKEVTMEKNAQPAQIRQMTMADTIEEIEANAYENFTGLRRVELSDKLKEIGANAFGAAKLDFVIIPKTLKEIGANAFGDCKQMKCVFYFGTETEWNEITFGSANDPLKSVPRYYYSEQKPTGSGDFWHFVNCEPMLW